jgi:hypothetical protein
MNLLFNAAQPSPVGEISPATDAGDQQIRFASCSYSKLLSASSPATRISSPSLFILAFNLRESA